MFIYSNNATRLATASHSFAVVVPARSIACNISFSDVIGAAGTAERTDTLSPLLFLPLRFVRCVCRACVVLLCARGPSCMRSKLNVCEYPCQTVAAQNDPCSQPAAQWSIECNWHLQIKSSRLWQRMRFACIWFWSGHNGAEGALCICVSLWIWELGDQPTTNMWCIASGIYEVPCYSNTMWYPAINMRIYMWLVHECSQTQSEWMVEKMVKQQKTANLYINQFKIIVFVYSVQPFKLVVQPWQAC